jgi:hypothetical protein
MGTLVKDARGRSKFPYYCYRDANGQRLLSITLLSGCLAHDQ